MVHSSSNHTVYILCIRFRVLLKFSPVFKERILDPDRNDTHDAMHSADF